MQGDSTHTTRTQHTRSDIVGLVWHPHLILYVILTSIYTIHNHGGIIWEVLIIWGGRLCANTHLVGNARGISGLRVGDHISKHSGRAEDGDEDGEGGRRGGGGDEERDIGTRKCKAENGQEMLQRE
jgi:hypothetical protein